MKNISMEKLESARPDLQPVNAVQFCLESLYQDNVKKLDDEVCQDCTYEELIGALLLARDVMSGDIPQLSGEQGTRLSLIDGVHELLNQEDPDRSWEERVESLEELQTFVEDRLATTLADKPWVGKDRG